MEMDEPIDDELLVQLHARLQRGETVELEVKEGKSNLPNEIWPTVSAFANTNGGWIILGMSEVGGEIEITGVKNPEAQIKNFFDILHNPNKLSSPILRDEDVGIVRSGDKRLIVIRVPAAPRKTKPVFINKSPFTGTFIRKHEGDYKCGEGEVTRMMREASAEDADAVILKGYDLSDLDMASLARFRRRDLTANPDVHRVGLSDLDYLRSLNAYRRDRHTGQEGLTVTGILLFGTMAAIRDWRGHHRIDFRIRDSTDLEQDRWVDRVLWDGNLFGAFETIYPKLVADLPTPFLLLDGVRVTQTDAHVAMREAFVNLLVHADYSEKQSSLIIKDEQGCSFQNPGNSRVRRLDMVAGNRSDPRNPNLVAAFRYIGLAEEAGSGIPKIVRAWKKLGFRTPDIDVGTERYEFQLKLARLHLIAPEDRAWLSQLSNVTEQPAHLALVYAREHATIDNSQLRTISGLLPRGAGKTLKDLRDLGYLTPEGSGRYTRYALSDTLKASVAEAFIDQGASAAEAWDAACGISRGESLGRSTASMGHTIGHKAEGSENTSSAIGHSEASLGHKDGSAGEGDTSSGHSEPGIGHSEFPLSNSDQASSDTMDADEQLWLDTELRSPPGFPGSHDDWSKMARVTEGVRSERRVTGAVLQAAVLAACALSPASQSELVQLTGRSRAQIKRAVRPLLETGKLVQTEEVVTHPNQRYAAG